MCLLDAFFCSDRASFFGRFWLVTFSTVDLARFGLIFAPRARHTLRMTLERTCRASHYKNIQKNRLSLKILDWLESQFGQFYLFNFHSLFSRTLFLIKLKSQEVRSTRITVFEIKMNTLSFSFHSNIVFDWINTSLNSRFTQTFL